MIKLVNNAIEKVKYPIKKRQIEFKTSSLPQALGDPAMIKQVFMNLLSNAVKFTVKREKAVIETGGFQEKDRNVYFIKDNGIGFDMQILRPGSLMFSSVYTAAKILKGTA